MLKPESSLEDVAFAVCTSFQSAGIVAVLCGGSAASFHAPSAYQTGDLDFVLHFEVYGVPGAILNELGFRASRARGIYEHAGTHLTLAILNGPVAIGDEIVNEWLTVTRGEEILHILRPEDAVKDRLAAAIHWRDPSAAAQAAKVALAAGVKPEAIREWCLTEGGELAYALFASIFNEGTPTESSEASL